MSNQNQSVGVSRWECRGLRYVAYIDGWRFREEEEFRQCHGSGLWFWKVLQCCKPVACDYSNHTNARNESGKDHVEGDFRDKKKSFRNALPQILATMAKNLILLGYGMTLGFPTIVIPSLQSAPANATLRLTDEEVSWFSSINLITVPLGCLVSGMVTQPFGRKRSMQALNIPFLITWIMFYYSNSVAMLYASLALTGLAGGLLEAPVLTYVAEITQPHLRGFLSATSSLSVIIGIFTQFLLGNFLDWRTISMINASAPFLAFLALCFIPESPHWLIGKNRLEDAQKSLCWLRGWTTPNNVQEEFESLVRAIHPDQQMSHHMKMGALEGQDTRKSSKKKCCSLQVKNYAKRTFILPFSLIAFCFFAGHFSGMTTLTTFAVNIFASLGAPIDSFLATLILGIAQLTGTSLCVILIHYTGKRPLVFLSTFGSAVLFGSVGLYAYVYLGVKKLDSGAYIKEHFQEMPNYSWVPMVCLIGGSFLAYTGIRLLPWILIGEVYPPEIRALASGASGSIGYIFGFLSNKTFFKLIEVLTLPGVYFFYGLIGLVSVLIFFFCLPETEGWTLLEIQEHFAGDRSLIRAGKRKSRNAKSTKGHDNPIAVNDQISKL